MNSLSEINFDCDSNYIYATLSPILIDSAR